MSTESASERYLKLAFQLNPMFQATELMDLRSRALRLKRLDKSGSDQKQQADVTLMRAAAKQQIASLQTNFWRMSLDQLKRQLEQIDVRKLPELAPVINRLRTAAACRGEFPKLAQESWMDLKLFNAFKSAVVLPPAEAGHAREAFLLRISDAKELKKMQQAAKKIESEYPILFSLEQDFFQTLAKFKIRRVSVDGDYSSGGGGGVSFSMPELGWPAWLVAFLLLRAIVRLISMAAGN